MIVEPSVQELLEYAENRYALVIAISRRAREISKGAEPLIKTQETSPVTIAANEIIEGKVKVYKEEDIQEENNDSIDDTEKTSEKTNNKETQQEE